MWLWSNGNYAITCFVPDQDWNAGALRSLSAVALIAATAFKHSMQFLFYFDHLWLSCHKPFPWLFSSINITVTIRSCWDRDTSMITASHDRYQYLKFYPVFQDSVPSQPWLIITCMRKMATVVTRWMSGVSSLCWLLDADRVKSLVNVEICGTVSRHVDHNCITVTDTTVIFV